LVVEQAFQLVTGNASFALPYWDWSKSSLLSNPNLDYTLTAFGGNGSPSNRNDPCLGRTNCGCPVTSVFTTSNGFFDIGPTGQSDGVSIRRGLGGTCFGSLSLPTPNQVASTEAMSNFAPSGGNNGFSVDLEFNLHGTVHDWVGGSMEMLEWSASDPIFFMHHCFVDLIFETWLRNNNPAVPGPNTAPTSGAPYGHNLYDCLGPFFPLMNNAYYFHQSTNFAYTYDVLSATTSTSSTSPHMHLAAQGRTGVALPGKRGHQFGVHSVVMEPVRKLHCYDMFQDWDEDDIDCGGEDCRPCSQAS